ncbi:MAG: putative sulfate exporter family transporter [Treponema sp.]
MSSKIGIKLADGSFFPVIMTGSQYPKTLQLTTVHNNQRQIRIDFLKKTAQEVDYLDSITIDELEVKNAGEPTIELQMSFDDNRDLHASVLDLDSGFRQEVCIQRIVYTKSTLSPKNSFFEAVKNTKIIQKIQEVWFGVTISGVITLFAWFLGKQFPIIGDAVIALVTGMVIALLWKNKGKAIAGLKFTANELLQATVVFLGFGMDINVIFKTGRQALPIIICTILVSQLLALVFYKYIRVSVNTATLIGAGFAVGGGGAIASVSPIIAADSEDIAQAISVIFLFNVLSVLFFPAFGHLMQLSTATGGPFGIFAGISIHNISAAATTAATWDTMWSLGSQTLDKTVTVKLTRTLAIIPVTLTIFVSRFLFGKNIQPQKKADFKKAFPLFIFYFLIASCITTVLVQYGFNTNIFYPFKVLSNLLLVMSMAATGLNSDMIALIKSGIKPLLLGLCCWISIAGVTLLMQKSMGLW